jgi:hypothetical protein
MSPQRYREHRGIAISLLVLWGRVPVFYTALFKAVRHSEGAEHSAVPHTPVSRSIKKRYG